MNAKHEKTEVDPNVLILSEPVQFGSETIEKLTFTPLRGKALKGLPLQMSMDDMLTLAARSCGQPTAVLEMMNLGDTMEAIAKVGNFLGRGLPTGDKHSA